ncbi:hypothetical protein GCM10007886_50760 [Methylobacterium gregans]|nr:hypothetical protein GCM10007886_50760 [Methylobacterium gregans]
MLTRQADERRVTCHRLLNGPRLRGQGLFLGSHSAGIRVEDVIDDADANVDHVAAKLSSVANARNGIMP